MTHYFFFLIIILGLKDEGMLQDEELSNANSPYFKKPGDYSLKIFDFYVCFMCDQPYNGGKHDCAGGVEVLFYYYH